MDYIVKGKKTPCSECKENTDWSVVLAKRETPMCPACSVELMQVLSANLFGHYDYPEIKKVNQGDIR